LVLDKRRKIGGGNDLKNQMEKSEFVLEDFLISELESL